MKRSSTWHTRPLQPPTASVALQRTLARGLAMLRQWRRVSRSRRELSALDDYQLRDLGLSRSQAVFESGKTFLQP